jgi:hypothetical protein
LRSVTSLEIRDRYLEELRAFWRAIPRIARLYETFPDAPVPFWHSGIMAVVHRLMLMSNAELLALGGSHMTLRNLVADEMGLPRQGGAGEGYGHRVLDIAW